MKPGLLTTIYAMSILPATIFMGLIGLMVAGATGTSDPIAVFSNVMDNKPLLVITLLFIAFAQVTTNVLNNVVLPAYLLMDVFKLSFKKSAVVVVDYYILRGCRLDLQKLYDVNGPYRGVNWAASSPRRWARRWRCTFSR